MRCLLIVDWLIEKAELFSERREDKSWNKLSVGWEWLWVHYFIKVERSALVSTLSIYLGKVVNDWLTIEGEVLSKVIPDASCARTWMSFPQIRYFTEMSKSPWIYIPFLNHRITSFWRPCCLAQRSINVWGIDWRRAPKKKIMIDTQSGVLCWSPVIL